jgi:hypothetical protein
LQIELEHAVAAAELVRVRHRKSRNKLSHLHQRFAGDGEHPVASRDRQQRGLVLGECLAATIRRLEINGVADAEREDAVQRQLRLPAQDRPDVTGFLTGQRNHQIQRERRARNRPFDFRVKILLEPFHIRNIRHDRIPPSSAQFLVACNH